MEVSTEYLLEQVMQKDLGKRLQVGQEVVELILDEQKSPEMEQDQTMLDRMVDAVASSWVNSSNFKVRTLCHGRCLSPVETKEHLLLWRCSALSAVASQLLLVALNRC